MLYYKSSAYANLSLVFPRFLFLLFSACFSTLQRYSELLAGNTGLKCNWRLTFFFVRSVAWHGIHQAEGNILMLIYDGFGVPTVIGSTLFIFSLFFFLQSSCLFYAYAICGEVVRRLRNLFEGQNYFPIYCLPETKSHWQKVVNLMWCEYDLRFSS